MGGAIGGFLISYICPPAGLALLLLGAWSAWLVWSPGVRRPPLTARVAAAVLGGEGGWLLNVLALPRDAQHIILGFPMPVMTLARDGGFAPGPPASLACAFLNLAIGIGLAYAALRALWPRLRPLLPRPSPRSRVDLPVRRPAVRGGLDRRVAPATGHPRSRPPMPAGGGTPGRGREFPRGPLREELENPEWSRREETA